MSPGLVSVLVTVLIVAAILFLLYVWSDWGRFKTKVRDFKNRGRVVYKPEQPKPSPTPPSRRVGEFPNGTILKNDGVYWRSGYGGWVEIHKSKIPKR